MTSSTGADDLTADPPTDHPDRPPLVPHSYALGGVFFAAGLRVAGFLAGFFINGTAIAAAPAASTAAPTAAAVFGFSFTALLALLAAFSADAPADFTLVLARSVSDASSASASSCVLAWGMADAGMLDIGFLRKMNRDCRIIVSEAQ